MPIVLNEKNVSKELAFCVNEDEKIVIFLATKGLNRDILVLTEKKRLLLVKFPLLGRSRIREEYHIDEIEAVDYFPNNNSIFLQIKMTQQTKMFKLPLAKSEFSIKKGFFVFINKIREMSSRAKPEYLVKNEQVLEIIKTNQGIFKLADLHIFLFRILEKKGENWELNEKIPFNSILEFDYYPASPDCLYLFIENNRAECRLFRIETSALFFYNAKKTDNPDMIIQNINESLSPHRKMPVPSYLHDGEKVKTTLKASSEISGGILQDVVLRLTNKRFFELIRSSEGKLSIAAEIDLSEISDIKIIKSDETDKDIVNIKYYFLSVQVADDKKYEYWVDREYEYAVNKLADYSKI